MISNAKVKKDILALFLILVGSFKFLTIKYDINVKIFVDIFYQVEEVPLYSQFTESFYHEWVLGFVKCFFCTY